RSWGRRNSRSTSARSCGSSAPRDPVDERRRRRRARDRGPRAAVLCRDFHRHAAAGAGRAVRGVDRRAVRRARVSRGGAGAGRRRARRRRLPPGSPVVAVTGSSGKTSVKEMIRAVLGAAYRVHATPANLNNLVGVPLTILAAPDDADALVVEAGASVPGEIARLRDVIEPTIAVITNVGYAHVEGFGSLAGVMREKLALVEGARLAVVGGDPPELAAEARRRVPTRVAGTAAGADVRPDSAELDDAGRARLVWQGHAVTLPVPGFQHIENPMLALAVGQAAGVAPAAAVAALAAAAIPPGRGALIELGGLTVIDDTYNANPT